MKDARVQYLRDAIERECGGIYVDYDAAQRVMHSLDASVANFAQGKMVAHPDAEGVCADGSHFNLFEHQCELAHSVSAERIQELGEIFGVYSDGVFKMHSASLRDLVRVALAESA
jgi:hypothetical protein